VALEIAATEPTGRSLKTPAAVSPVPYWTAAVTMLLEGALGSLEPRWLCWSSFVRCSCDRPRRCEGPGEWLAGDISHPRRFSRGNKIPSASPAAGYREAGQCCTVMGPSSIVVLVHPSHSTAIG
jgi:hypothetical protein